MSTEEALGEDTRTLLDYLVKKEVSFTKHPPFHFVFFIHASLPAGEFPKQLSSSTR